VDHDTGINDVFGGIPTMQDIMTLHNNSIVVIPILIKGSGWIFLRQVKFGIKPCLIFVQIKVKNTWIPICITCQNDMWQAVPFFIGKWMKSNIWKAISDADGDNTPIIGQNALQTSCNLDGLVVDIVLVPLKLS